MSVVAISEARNRLEKARLERRDTHELLTCQFNPTYYTVIKTAAWTRTATRASPSSAPPEFIGSGPRVLTMALLFDGWETGLDVLAAVTTLQGWANPTAESIQNHQPQPPVLLFHWGATWSFEAFLRSANVTFTLFKADGTPVRATVAVTLEETPVRPERQNPTSGGTAPTRSHVVSAGETLHAIAHRHYGDVRHWRGLARCNGIEDPLRLRAGRRLEIPAISDVAPRP